MIPYNRIAILGLGLIGSSVARAVKQHKLAHYVAAFDTSEHAISYMLEQKLVHSVNAYAGQAVLGADLIIFATPPGNFESLARDIAPFVQEGALITDVASVKRYAVSAIKTNLPAYAHYVPAHPIAGSERTGPEAGKADLFAGKKIILTPEEGDVMSRPVADARTFWQALGAKIEFMPAALHDHIYAYVSHLPQLVAYAAQESLRDIPAPGSETFTRFTRLAASDAVLWADICLANTDFILEALNEFILFATQISGELSENTASPANGTDVRAVLFSKIVATCLIATVSLLEDRTGIHPASYTGSGFTDMTLPAREDPESALAAISEHHHTLAPMLKTALQHLHDIKSALQSPEKLLPLLISLQKTT